MMKPVNRIFLILGAMSMFSLFQFDAMGANTEKGCNTVGAGKYCLKKGDKHDCPAGCYCDGMKNSPAVANIPGLKSDMEVRYACAMQDSTKKNQLSNAGVHYCGLKKTSPRGSDSSSDCEGGKTAYDGSDNCTGTVNAGKYCESKNNHNKCPEGCYCEGGKNAVGSQWWNSSEWDDIPVEAWCNGHKRSYLTSYLNDRGIFYCPEAFPDSDKGAKGKGDCYFTVDGIKVYEKTKYAIDRGNYFPEGKITQQACECESGTQCYCPGKQSVSASYTQAVGREICPSNKVSNSKKTDCVWPDRTEWVAAQNAYVSHYAVGDNGGGDQGGGTSGGGNNGGGTQGGDSHSCQPGQYWSDITAEARVVPTAVSRDTANDLRTALGGSCTYCEAGYYCPGGTQGRVACPEGTYTNTTGQTQCLVCNGTVTKTGNLNTGCSTDPDNPGNNYNVTYNCGDHGTGDLSNNGASYASGTQVTTLASTACDRNEGYTFSNWKCMAGSMELSVNNAGQFTMPPSNVTCTAQWSTGGNGNGNGGGNGNENEDAVCPVGQYLPADGEDADDCEQCSGNYVCPGDDASYRCPWTVSGNTCGGILDAGQLKKGKSRNRDCWKFFNSPSDYRECVYGFSID